MKLVRDTVKSQETSALVESSKRHTCTNADQVGFLHLSLTLEVYSSCVYSLLSSTTAGPLLKLF